MVHQGWYIKAADVQFIKTTNEDADAVAQFLKIANADADVKNADVSRMWMQSIGLRKRQVGADFQMKW